MASSSCSAVTAASTSRAARSSCAHAELDAAGDRALRRAGRRRPGHRSGPRSSPRRARASWTNPDNGTTIDGGTRRPRPSPATSTATRTLGTRGYCPGVDHPERVEPVQRGIRRRASETGTGNGGNTTPRTGSQPDDHGPCGTADGTAPICVITAGDHATRRTPAPSRRSARLGRCLNNLTIAQLNAGIRADYSATYSCTTAAADRHVHRSSTASSSNVS